MASFTVKEISEMLQTDQETVRRWIRNGQLTATAENVARKTGKTVGEKSLLDFMASNTKYAERVVKYGTGGIVAGGIVAGALAIAVAAKYLSTDKVYSVSQKDLLIFAKKEIVEKQHSIENKQKQIAQLESEIEIEKERIASLQTLIASKKSNEVQK